MSKVTLDTSRFATMGDCMSWMRRKKLPPRNLTLAIFGLDNAGKTVTALGLKGDNLDTLSPTVGFNCMEFKFGRFNVTMYDLGGGKGIRGIWKNYFHEIYGLVYVLDSTEGERLSEAKGALLELLQNVRVAGKPLLVLANKQDMEGAMDEIDIIEAISLEEIVNVNKCPCRIETCAAIKGQGKKLDKAIQSGFMWLLETIDGDYENLNLRIEKDMATQKKIEDEEKRLRREQFKKLEEERDRREQEELAANGGVEEEISENPFKPLDLAELTQKEENEKKARKAEKLKQAELDAAENTETNAQIPALAAGKLPPLISPRKSRTGDLNNSNSELVEEIDQEVIDTYTNNKMKPAPRSGSPIPSSPVKSRSSEFIDEESDADANSSSGFLSSSIPPPRRLIPLDGGLEIANDKKKKRRKKRKIRRNQTAPLVEEEEQASKESDSTPSLQLGWGTPTPPPSSASLNKNFSIRSLQLEPVTEFTSQKTESPEAFSTVKWGLAEDLPQLADDATQSNTRKGPNYDEDDIVT